LKLYLKGDWAQAAEGFLRALDVKGSADGPTNAILCFMEEFENVAPKDWRGFREVEE